MYKKILISLSLSLFALNAFAKEGVNTENNKLTEPNVVAEADKKLEKVVNITNKDFSILAFGDIADCREDREIGVKTVVSIVSKQNFDFMILLGDLVYPDATVTELKNCFGKYFDLFKNKIFPIPGNHEYNIALGMPYFHFFKNTVNNIKKQESYTVNQKFVNKMPNYYSFNKNNWSFIFLDSNLLKSEDKKEQLKWFEERLKEKKSCSIVSIHHPLYSSGIRPTSDNVEEFEEILKKYQPTIVLSGHDHHFEERDLINNTKYYVVGTGGSKIYKTINPFGEKKLNTSFEYGVLKLTLKENSYDSSFITKDKELFKKNHSCL